MRSLDKKGFTLVEMIVTLSIALIVIGIAGGILISSLSLFAHEERSVSTKQVALEISEFLNEQTKYAMIIDPIESTTVPSSGTYPQRPYEEYFEYDGDSDPFASNALFYVGDENGNPTTRGYLWYKRPGDAGSAVNAFGKAFYGGLRMELDVSEIFTRSTGGIVVTQTIRLFSGDNEVRTATNTFDLVNSFTYVDLNGADNDWAGDISLDGGSFTGYYIVKPLTPIKSLAS
jgi:prepilin-type N-terminal cleavage/methylation domain-containing protein